MNPKLPQLVRVSSKLPCQICGKPDWCMISCRGDVAVCTRVESEIELEAFNGHLHHVPVRDRQLPADIRRSAKVCSNHGEILDFCPVFEPHLHSFTNNRRARTAEILGLMPSTLDRFPIGWAQSPDAIAYPVMQFDRPQIVGVRYRSADWKEGDPKSRKWWSASGSTHSVMLPFEQLEPNVPLFVCEGPSDTLAAAQVGVHAVGRWSCDLDGFQASIVAKYADMTNSSCIVVVGDNGDAGDRGRIGAETGAARLRLLAPTRKVIHAQPPAGIKDIREWVLRGATAQDLLEATKGIMS